MKRIPLTQGRFALVNDCDYEYLIQWKWHVSHNGCDTFYRAELNQSENLAAEIAFGCTTLLQHEWDFK